MANLFANSGDPDQMPHSAVSDLGLQCLSSTLLEVSRQLWVKVICLNFACSLVRIYGVKIVWVIHGMNYVYP